MIKKEKSFIKVYGAVEIGKCATILTNKGTVRTSPVENFMFRTNGDKKIETKNSIYYHYE